ncbi:MAG: hypothetical protein ACPL3A_07000 [Thermoanaerobacteraceae bacterium]
MLKGIKWQIVLLTLALALGMLFAGFQFYQEKYLPDKITKEIYGIKSVKSVKIETKSKEYIIDVKLDKVNNLMETYKNIQAKVLKYPVKIEINIIDNSDNKLNNIYYKSQFAVYEGIQKGDYLNMFNFIKDLSKTENVEFNINMDSKNIYLDFRDGSNYFYKIVPRVPSEGGI